jgi:hypothetical protein
MLKRIDKIVNCKHVWKNDKILSNFYCKKCDYFVSDIMLNNLIMTQKLIDSGMKMKDIKKYIK